MVHPEIGLQQLRRVADDLEDIAAVEVEPKLEGRQLIMVLAPSARRKK